MVLTLKIGVLRDLSTLPDVCSSSATVALCDTQSYLTERISTIAAIFLGFECV